MRPTRAVVASLLAGSITFGGCAPRLAPGPPHLTTAADVDTILAELEGDRDEGAIPSDVDGDGVADSMDRCPHEAEDFAFLETPDGCPDRPDLDGDADGIADADDPCPETAGDDCAFYRHTLAMATPTRIAVYWKVTFEHASATLTSSGRAIVLEVARVLADAPEIALLTVRACDSDLALASARAAAVRTTLVASGADPSRILERAIVGPRRDRGIDFCIGSESSAPDCARPTEHQR